MGSLLSNRAGLKRNAADGLFTKPSNLGKFVGAGRWILWGYVLDIFLSDPWHGGRALGFFRFPETRLFRLAGASLVDRSLFFPDYLSSSLLGGQKEEEKRFFTRTG
jgi:hypothetical protein